MRTPEEDTDTRDKIRQLLEEAYNELDAALAKYGYDPTDERALSTWNIVKTSKQGQNMIVGIQIFLGLIGVIGPLSQR